MRPFCRKSINNSSKPFTWSTPCIRYPSHPPSSSSRTENERKEKELWSYAWKGKGTATGKKCNRLPKGHLHIRVHCRILVLKWLASGGEEEQLLLSIKVQWGIIQRFRVPTLFISLLCPFSFLSSYPLLCIRIRASFPHSLCWTYGRL